MASFNQQEPSAHSCAATTWRPLDVLYDPSLASSNCIVLLNVSLRKNIKHLHRLWNESPLRVVLDGAANHLHENLLMPSGSALAPPHLISGDFDSVKSEVLSSFKAQNVSIVHTPDQDETDFTKGLRLVASRLPPSTDSILVFGYNCGRFDQIIATINTLFTASSILPTVPIYLVHATSVSFLLQPGSHEIAIDQRLTGQPCGLIPIGHPAYEVTTSGLKWNLSSSRLAFGDIISTSNTYDAIASRVSVTTDSPLLWTMEIPDLVSNDSL